MSKEIVKDIADRLTTATIVRAVGVSEHSVRNARWQGAFPASWYPVIRGLCEKAGVDCPEIAFNFKSPSSNAASLADQAEGSLPKQQLGNRVPRGQGAGAE